MELGIVPIADRPEHTGLVAARELEAHLGRRHDLECVSQVAAIEGDLPAATLHACIQVASVISQFRAGGGNQKFAQRRRAIRMPPTTVASLLGTAGTNLWYTSPVTVTLSASDGAGSRVAATFYAVDDPACSPAALATCHSYTAPFPIAVDGRNAVTFFSRDLVGNYEAAKSVSVTSTSCRRSSPLPRRRLPMSADGTTRL